MPLCLYFSLYSCTFVNIAAALFLYSVRRTNHWLKFSESENLVSHLLEGASFLAPTYTKRKISIFLEFSLSHLRLNSNVFFNLNECFYFSLITQVILTRRTEEVSHSPMSVVPFTVYNVHHLTSAHNLW